MVDEVVPVWNLVVDRASIVTKGNAAVHAARRLAARRFVRQGNDEFAIVANAVGRRLIFAVSPVNLEKPGHLTHFLCTFRASTAEATAFHSSAAVFRRKRIRIPAKAPGAAVILDVF
jgi:hypothetical protein